MEQRIARFISGLRASGVRVSIAEAEDAWQAVEHMGVIDRESFRLSLRSTLVKEAVDIPIFDELFPMYFGTDAPPLINPQAELSPDEQNMLQQAVRQLAGDLEELLSWLLSGRGPTEEELEDLAQQAGMQFFDMPHQTQWYARRMLNLLGWNRLPEVLDMLWEKLAEMGLSPQQIEELKDQVGENMGAIRQQVENFAGRQIRDNISDRQRTRRQNVHDLMWRPLGSLSESEMDVLRDQVRRLAARLRSRAALRQKRAKQGKLDVKATIRANLRYGGVPLELRVKKRRLKPKLAVVVDVSQSMRSVVEFFLRMLYELQDQVQKTSSFAFYERLEDITPEMRTLGIEAALEHVFEIFPYTPYGTDIGDGLRTLAARHMHAIDHRTTVIFVSDGRNNYTNPELGIVDDIRKRSRKLIWLTPEYPLQWGTGDSVMHFYAALCDEVYPVRNLAQLADAIDQMLE